MITTEVFSCILCGEQSPPHIIQSKVKGDRHEILRGISHLFNGGIFGSPDTKEQILLREKELGNIQFPALFLGDSRYDYIAATKAELDFIFISGWTEMKDWQEFCKTLKLQQMDSISALVFDL